MADNLALKKFLFIYYKMKSHFVVKIPNQKPDKNEGILRESLPCAKGGVAA
jgi:hypothetical protein